MSAYTVGTVKDSGEKRWWQNYEMTKFATDRFSALRPATEAEAELMTKIVWETDTDADRKRLRELLTT